MRNIIALLTRARVIQKTAARKTGVHLTGISGTQKTCLTAGLFAVRPRSCLILLPGREELREYRRDLSILLPEIKIEELYPDDFSGLGVKGRGLEIAAGRMLLLRHLYEGRPGIIMLTAEAFGQALPKPDELFAASLKLAIGKNQDMLEVVKELAVYGYERLDIVDAPGQFCVRGGIVDVFPLGSVTPVRLEWLGDELDSIRAFSAENQRSAEELSEAQIPPRQNLLNNSLNADIFSYITRDALLIIDEPRQVKEKLAAAAAAALPVDKLLPWEELYKKISEKTNVAALSALPSDILPGLTAESAGLHILAPYHRQLDLLTEDLGKWLREGLRPVIIMGGAAKAAGLAKNLADRGLDAVLWPQDSPPPLKGVLVTAGELSAGFRITGEDWLLLSEQDIFGVFKKKRLPVKQTGRQMRYFSDIKAGDYVVHAVHGVGKYAGSETLTVGGMQRDYLLVRYAGDDKLYIPVDQVQLLHKYIGAEGHAPRLSRMGGTDWSRVRGKAKAAVTELAGELLRLQAQRKLLPGHAFSQDTVWQKEFEEAFVFEETPDQLKSIEEIKADMERPYPMDRLLCGDVGYGKTEVAIRASFKAVMDGKQVAILVPTTVLAQQHYLTFSERMQAFGINVDMVSRFKTAREQRKTLARTAKGQVDILIGTHRLLQSDAAFRALGLLVIDEEQRFGVGQKEKIKRWSSGVDVLVLSATPIPRTLHMGLVSARDMSVIETPPEDRLPVETYVAEYDSQLVRQAVLREINRGGYVYYVYNKVKDIDKVAENLSRLVPGARIKVAHGQMAEELLETAMMEFYEGKYDILVCTTIIENGLDVSLANTIIVQGAENFGLAQLYQMRGRVGRSTRLAYAYFLYPKQRALSEVAEKRLSAIRDFTDLGAGFRIAMRDLEIRGAGNILGPQQHGHILNVGFETYCRLLEETMQELSGQRPRQEELVDTSIEVDIDACLPDGYIDDAGHKLDVYRRLPFIEDKAAMRDMRDELTDRFGEPPEAVARLLQLAMLRGICRRLGVRSISARSLEVKMIFSGQSVIRPEAIMAFVRKYAAVLRQGPPVTLKVRRRGQTDVLNWLEEIMAVLAG